MIVKAWASRSMKRGSLVTGSLCAVCTASRLRPPRHLLLCGVERWRPSSSALCRHLRRCPLASRLRSGSLRTVRRTLASLCHCRHSCTCSPRTLSHQRRFCCVFHTRTCLHALADILRCNVCFFASPPVRMPCSFEVNEDSLLSLPASASLATLFSGFNVSACTEMTVTGNQPLASAPQVCGMIACSECL
jgi:hypothetical protein